MYCLTAACLVTMTVCREQDCLVPPDLSLSVRVQVLSYWIGLLLHADELTLLDMWEDVDYSPPPRDAKVVMPCHSLTLLYIYLLLHTNHFFPFCQPCSASSHSLERTCIINSKADNSSWAWEGETAPRPELPR